MYKYPDKNDALTIELIESVSIGNYWSDIEKTREYRRKLITPLVDSLKYLLELLEGELNLLYSTNTNRLVNILTIVGLGLSALGALASWLGLF